MSDEPPFVPVVIGPLPDDAPEWARILNENLGSVAMGQNQTNANLSGILDVVTRVKDEIGPIVSSLAASPMLRMLGVKS